MIVVGSYDFTSGRLNILKSIFTHSDSPRKLNLLDRWSLRRNSFDPIIKMRTHFIQKTVMVIMMVVIVSSISMAGLFGISLSRSMIDTRMPTFGCFLLHLHPFLGQLDRVNSEVPGLNRFKNNSLLKEIELLFRNVSYFYHASKILHHLILEDLLVTVKFHLFLIE